MAVCCGWMLGSLGGGTARAWAAVSKPSTNSIQQATAAPAVKPIPKSVFMYDYTAASKDPFYPNSNRRMPQSTGARSPEGKTLPINELPILKGIVRNAKNRPLALINDQIFAVGETRPVTLSGREANVCCLEIGRGSAVISMNNKRHVLVLPAN
jgi:hypothetical protein